MKYLFRPSLTGTHNRTADSVRGDLRAFDDSVTVQPESALVNASDYTVVTPEVVVAPAPAPRDISKLTIRRRLRDLGKEDAFDVALNAIAHARADWDDAQVVSTGDAMFTTHAEALKGSLGLTNDQFTALIAAY